MNQIFKTRSNAWNKNGKNRYEMKIEQFLIHTLRMLAKVSDVIPCPSIMSYIEMVALKL